ncbi:MAG: efflux RND transporter periplasmic adaptor subunit [Planctomycetes bacterium]|nr:efflux RND transporter periplasmic adaptor subunit [Planctomycetota bacterium]
MNPRWLHLMVSSSLLVLAGTRSSLANAPPPQVEVCRPVAREVSDFEDFTGRTEAVTSVEVRSRVTGALDKANFQDGTEVRKGDLLFEIDPRLNQAEVDRATAELVHGQAQLQHLTAELDRQKTLLKTHTTSQNEYDQAASAREEGAAQLQVAKANLEIARLNLDFTRIQAPIDGRIGRRLVDPGSLVKADDTVLATIVGLDPIYVYFKVDEKTVLRQRRLIQEKKLSPAPDGKFPVWMGLADEEGFPHKGVVDFVNNQVDPSTGTLRVRAVFPNPDHLLIPGMFARVRVAIGPPYQGLLVPERAVWASQGRHFVAIVTDRNTLEYRPVEVGLVTEGMRAIKKGLKAEDQVIVSNVEGLTAPGQVVKPKLVPANPPAPATPSKEKDS